MDTINAIHDYPQGLYTQASHNGSTISNNGSISRSIRPDRQADSAEKSIFIQALNQWTASAKLARALEREEYAQLDSLTRMLLTRNGLIANLVTLCRTNPRQDSRMAILALITHLADNDDFLCTLSIQRIAKILCRKEENIREGINHLEDKGVIGVSRVDGFPNTYWPRISPALLDSRASVVWFADAFSEKARPRGRPRKTPPVYGGYFSGETPVPEKTPPVDRKNPPRRQDSTSLIELHSKVSVKGSSKRGRGQKLENKTYTRTEMEERVARAGFGVHRS